jgi:hypothetical protein
MQKARLYGTLVLGLFVGVVACDRPDEDAVTDEEALRALLEDPGMDPETMAYITEIQELQQRIEPVQQEALQDEALAGQLVAIQRRIETSMRAEDQELFSRIDRFQDDIAAAEAAGDQQRLQALMVQAQGIQLEVEALQAKVLQRPDIREPLEAFETAHRARMIEIDPAVEPLLARVDELMANLPW